jgi:hypothetical protein
MKVNVGLGGNFDFFIKAKGRTDWTQTFAVTDADVYLANDVPLSNSKLFTLPLHQKSKNMTIKVQASGPFPVSLLSIIWEGHYSGKYYNRR